MRVGWDGDQNEPCPSVTSNPPSYSHLTDLLNFIVRSDDKTLPPNHRLHLDYSISPVKAVWTYHITMSRPSKAPAIICAENIALTRLLHEVPQPPSRNQIPQSLVDKEGYALPLLKEQDLVETLAFLSKTTDGPDHIPAVCILQDPKGVSLKVILAINKSTPQKGDQVLRNLQSEFEKIFSVLKLARYGQSFLKYH